VDDLFGPGRKLYMRGVRGQCGLLIKAPAGKVSYQKVTQDELFEAVPDFPRDRVGPEWLLIAVGDDVQTTLFVRPWKDTEGHIAEWPETETR
jgi:hypothetical protein